MAVASCWPSYAIIVSFLSLLFYDVLYKQWNDFASHGILGVVAVFLVTMSCLILGDTITGFLLLVPFLAIILYIAIEAGKEKPTLESKPPPEPPAECIDPCSITGCQKLVQVLVSKEDSALARCRAKQTQGPSGSTANSRGGSNGGGSSGSGSSSGGSSGGGSSGGSSSGGGSSGGSSSGGGSSGGGSSGGSSSGGSSSGGGSSRGGSSSGSNVPEVTIGAGVTTC